MASKRTIKRIVLGTIWTIITGGVVTLLVAANSRRQEHRCTDVRISVRGTGERYYISKSDVNFLLCANGEPTLKGLGMGSIDLARLERRLEGQSWIKDAELYFDRANVLHVIVTERQPIARVFANDGRSFYIDSSGARLPLLRNISARVPVVTGYPSATRPLPKDSTLMRQVRNLVQHINNDPFWSAQLAQADITQAGFELLPTVGNHIIRIGNADSLDQKLNRLLLFYKQVLSKAGFDKYSVVDVQYAGQVVALHRGEHTQVDSAQLKRNIANLLKADQLMAGHEAAETAVGKAVPAADSLTVAKTEDTDLTKVTREEKAATTPVKKVEQKKVQAEVKKTEVKPPVRQAPAKQQQPKAVMKKKPDQ